MAPPLTAFRGVTGSPVSWLMWWPFRQGQFQHAIAVFGLGLGFIHVVRQGETARHLAVVALERSTFSPFFSSFSIFDSALIEPGCLRC